MNCAALPLTIIGIILIIWGLTELFSWLTSRPPKHNDINQIIKGDIKDWDKKVNECHKDKYDKWRL